MLIIPPAHCAELNTHTHTHSKGWLEQRDKVTGLLETDSRRQSFPMSKLKTQPEMFFVGLEEQ